jgi:putative SOS response-associated peptidase YedK
MCGAFTLFSSPKDIQRFFDVQPISLILQPNYNVAPTQEIPVIIQQEDGKHLKKRHWGLVPFWAKDIAIGSRMVNARVESRAPKRSI